ncbi:unnamed protein product [Arctogadus glacialis]
MAGGGAPTAEPPDRRAPRPPSPPTAEPPDRGAPRPRSAPTTERPDHGAPPPTTEPPPTAGPDRRVGRHGYSVLFCLLMRHDVSNLAKSHSL